MHPCTQHRTRATDPVVHLFEQIDKRDQLRAELALLLLRIRLLARVMPTDK